MSETLLILLAIAPVLVVPLAVVSKCSGAPFCPVPDQFDFADSSLFTEFLDSMRREITYAFFVPQALLEPAGIEFPRLQFSTFKVATTFDATGLPDVSRRDGT